MKKEYVSPAAEKVEFNYIESVAACSGNEGVGNTSRNALPGSGGWVCPCYEYDSWIDETGMCKGHY